LLAAPGDSLQFYRQHVHAQEVPPNKNKRTHHNEKPETHLARQCPGAPQPPCHGGFGPSQDRLFSIDDLRTERWTRDRDYFVAAATGLGAKVFVQSADASEQKQIAQIENLISRGVDVLVIVPYNATVLNNAIREAKKANIKVVSYDRLALNADLDAYISFDNKAVGEMQAQGVVQVKPKGNYYLLGGAPTDNNAKMLREGQMAVLQPLVDKGDIKIVGKQWVKDWSPAEALAIIENALTANNNKIDAIVASNDSTAGGAIQALSSQKLSGKVAVSGQDADLAAVKRVVDGDAVDDGLQAPQAARRRSGQAVGPAGAQREARLQRPIRQRLQEGQHAAAQADDADQIERRPAGH
jgi:D-xylose ABC transporter substrate-binding protein